MIHAVVQVFWLNQKLTFLLLQDGPERMAEEAKLFKYHFPYLYDEVWPFCAFNSKIFNDHEDV